MIYEDGDDDEAVDFDEEECKLLEEHRETLSFSANGKTVSHTFTEEGSRAKDNFVLASSNEFVGSRGASRAYTDDSWSTQLMDASPNTDISCGVTLLVQVDSRVGEELATNTLSRRVLIRLKDLQFILKCIRMMSKFINRLFIICSVIIILTACKARYLNSTLSYKQLENGKYEIMWAETNGKRNGLSLGYDTDGRLIVAESYVNGKLTGEFITFWNDSLIFFHGFYLNGKLEGPFEQYSDNGNISRKGFFSKDVKIGKWEEYTYDGRLNRILEYFKNGEIKVILDNRLELPVPKE